jgi:hypothetical protein
MFEKELQSMKKIMREIKKVKWDKVIEEIIIFGLVLGLLAYLFESGLLGMIVASLMFWLFIKAIAGRWEIY